MSSFPGVTVKILDESLVSPVSELASPAIGAILSKDGLDRFAVYSGETAQGYYYVENLSEWFSRLTTYYNTNFPGFSATNGITLATRDLKNESGTTFSAEWYAVHNFLQYGSPCYVSWQSSGGSGDFKYLDFDVVFQGASGSAYQSLVTDVLSERSGTDRPVFGVYSISSTTAISGSMTVPSPSEGSEACVVYGEKKHFNINSDSTDIVRTTLAADVAGCISRTDRDSYPWFSPAGSRRGRIVNAIGLTKNLSNSEKGLLYSSKVNPVFNVPGEGILLFGDKTLAASTSSLSSINVGRLFIYLKKTLIPLARGVLFEQNDATTRSLFVSAAESVLNQVQALRGISEYKVVCDETNNTPEIIESKNFVADILIKPIPSINFVRLTLTNKDLSSTL